MSTMFEELVRRFNEENNEEAGEHWTPRDAVRLMAKLVFLPIGDRIQATTSPSLARHTGDENEPLSAMPNRWKLTLKYPS